MNKAQQIGQAGERAIFGRVWEKGTIRRLYISVAGHDRIDYGYLDLATGEYVAGKRDIERWFHRGVVDFAAVAQKL